MSNLCRDGLHNWVKKCLNPKLFNYSTVSNIIEVNLPDKKESRIKALITARKLNKVINKKFPDIGDMFYGTNNYHNYGIIYINPTSEQLTRLNTEKDQTVKEADLYDSYQENMERLDMLRREKGQFYNSVGDVFTTRADAEASERDLDKELEKFRDESIEIDNQVNYRLKSTDEEGDIKPFDDLRFSQSEQMIGSLQEGLNWLRTVLPNADVRLVNGLIDNIAKGSYNTVTDLIEASKQFADKGVIKHEAGHFVFNNLPKSEQEKLLNEGSKLFGIPRGESKTTVKYSQAQQNETQYTLRSIDILNNLTFKQQQEWNKWQKGTITAEQLIDRLQIPKEQKSIVVESLNENTISEEVAIDIASKYNFTIEINTAKEISKYSKTNTTEGQFFYEGATYEDRLWDGYFKNDVEISQQEFQKASKEYHSKRDTETQPTQHYSNLTVPGGTNYTENEISTPLITPSIKGHAQFSTDNGIGWFRSDDKTVDELKGNWIKNESELPNEFIFSGERYFKENGEWQTKSKFIEDIETVIWRYNMSLGNERIQNKPNEKTRRILEVQSDLFQKGRDKELLVESKTQNKSGVGSIPYTTTGKYAGLLDRIRNKANEVLGKTFSERPDGQTIELEGNTYYTMNGMWYLKEKEFTNENQFLQLLNKDNNWVTFFVKSIIQDSAKKGYEKVLFPKGDTAAKIEGHETLEGFKKAKENRIKELENTIKDKTSNNKYDTRDEFLDIKYIKQDNKWYQQVEGDLNLTREYTLEEIFPNETQEINQLKQELADVESGQTQLSSIANFYESTVTNILKKNGYNPVEITDEYGNKWNSIELTPEIKQQVENIKFSSPRLKYEGDLAIEEKIMERLEKSSDSYPPSTVIGKFFKAIKDFLKDLFKQRDRVQKFIDNVNSGKYRNLQRPDNLNASEETRYSQLTPQQKQQAQQLYSQYLDTIFPDGKVTEIDDSLYINVLNQLEQENTIEKDCTGKSKLKAEKGLQTNFNRGGKWKLIRDLKGYPTHKEGGVDLTIGKNGVSIKNGDTEFIAKYGLVIPKN